MVVRVTTMSVTIEDADDCAHLHVDTSLDRVDLDAALQADGLGSIAADGADLDVDGLHVRAAAESGAPDWESRWAAMIGYARRAGWLSADGRSVRAHIEHTR